MGTLIIFGLIVAGFKIWKEFREPVIPASFNRNIQKINQDRGNGMSEKQIYQNKINGRYR